MTERDLVLFTQDGKAAPDLFRLWNSKGAGQPLMLRAALIEQDRSATRYFRGLWERAFPTRDSLPFAPLADDRGLGSDLFWEVFA